MGQNVCRMNGANVFCTKLSKKWFLLHLDWLKFAIYMLHFVVNDPVAMVFVSCEVSCLKMDLRYITTNRL